MIDRRKRAVIGVADRLGWLNWADREVIHLVLDQAPTAVPSEIAQGVVPRPRSPRTSREGSEKGKSVPEDSHEGLLNLEIQIRRQFSKEELTKPQPGPVFAEQPEAFVSWVRASLVSLERSSRVGINPFFNARLGRETRVWIAYGFLGRQSTKSKRFLPALVHLWNEVIALENEPPKADVDHITG